MDVPMSPMAGLGGQPSSTWACWMILQLAVALFDNTSLIRNALTSLTLSICNGNANILR